MATAVRSALCSPQFPAVAVEAARAEQRDQLCRRRPSCAPTPRRAATRLCASSAPTCAAAPRLRATTAAAPAPASTDTDCAWTSGPFGVGCANGATVRADSDAAEDNPIYGGASAVPDTTNALYRLAALALRRVRGPRARQDDKAKCFGNAILGAWRTPRTCAPTSSPARAPSRGPTRASRLRSGTPTPTWKRAMASRGGEQLRHWVRGHPGTALPADRRQCERQHAFALYDTTSLYGLPDFNAGPRFDEPVGGMVTIKFVYELASRKPDQGVVHRPARRRGARPTRSAT